MIHILCPDCCEDLADIYPAFNVVKNAFFDKIIKEHGNIDLEMFDFKAELLPGIAFILDALHIKNHCCRVHILGTTDFDL
jgi:DNA-directed RNA polymerase subunit N (RpoN/RPB10)